MTRTLTPILLVVHALFLLSGCSEGDSSARANQNRTTNAPIQAEGFIVRTRQLSENIEMPGTLLPFETTQIRPEISGRIVELNIPEGRQVKKGTLLIRLFDGDLQAQLQKLVVQQQIASKTSERQKELLKISGISQQEADLGELAVNNLNADIELVKVSINKTRIVAPYDGKIGLKYFSLGAYVTPTDILTTISQVNELKLEFTVPEKYSDKMKTGRKVLFRIDGKDGDYPATIMATESIIEANTRSLKVRALVKGNGNSLVAGGFAKVLLQFGQTDRPLVIPTQAVIPGARDKQVIVYKNGKPAFQIVQTGIRDSSFVQVLTGLKEGDTVVTTGLLAIRPESQVKLNAVE
ncbi:MAG TPA: efflux RND transporter periplasmic adaptor subunit [Flavitalea sp.]|nr:efflux RND transporter periplasmic adaptor subunit [Flavitalea sp.]